MSEKTKQQIMDLVEDVLVGEIPMGLREKICDRLWDMLCDEVEEVEDNG